MNVQELRTLIDYHYWARDRMLDAVERLTPAQFTQTIENSFPSVQRTVLHLYWAEAIWYARWLGQDVPPQPVPADFGDVPAVRRAWAEMERQVRDFVDTLGEDGISRVIAYRMADGQSYAHPFWQMMQHLVNHGSYHRGQVTMMLRQLGVSPAEQMDLSAFYRQAAART